MKRLLCIVGGMNAGGAETFLMKVYRQLDKSKYQMDFAVGAKEKGFYDDEILMMGGKIYHISPKSEGLFKNFGEIKKIVAENNYTCVLRTSQHSLSALELYAAKKGGATVRAFRSSNSNTTSASKKDLLLHKMCGFMPKIYANVRLAPSTEAAEFMFGNKCVKNNKVSILHNAVDLSVFRYDVDKRAEIRGELGVENNVVIGHVGRFNSQKNHSFLLDVFAKMKTKEPRAVLVLVGKGELEQPIKEKIETLGLSDSVIFTGVRSDVPALLSAMDVFVFPSFYEGMPNTVIEAQATGLPCIIADTITREADITGLVKYMSLGETADAWADVALSAISVERADTRQKFIDNKYDIDSTVKYFTELVFDREK